MCSGKIYYDLIEEEKNKKNDIVFVRLEQLYPFPAKTLAKVLKNTKKQSSYGVKKNPKIWEHGTQ